MRCTKCGSDNREGRKCCAKCAAPLARSCPQCGASNEPGEDFCGECAAALGQPPAASRKSNDTPIRVADTPAPENLEGERKTVTALFADNFTATAPNRLWVADISYIPTWAGLLY